MKTKALLRLGIGFFSILACISLLLHLLEVRDVLFGAIGVLMLGLVGFCLLSLKSIEYKSQNMKMKRLYYGYVLLGLIFILSIYLFALALSEEVARDRLEQFFPIIFIFIFLIFSVIGFRSIKLYPEVKTFKKVAVLSIFLGSILIIGFLVFFCLRIFR